MRARQSLAQGLWEAGRREEAAEHFQEMLRLNPGDNQGIRYLLATLLLDLDRDDDLRRLLAEYKNDAMAPWAYTKVLLAFRSEGEAAHTKKLLMQAVKVNKHVPDYLLGHKQPPRELPTYVSIGGEDEAVSYAVANRSAWLNTPGAVTWLRKTLDLPLPEASKPRRPSWPQLKLALRGCPQEQDEVWQVDVVPAPEAEGSWVALVVNLATGEPLGIEMFDYEPAPGDVWDHLVEIMRNPPRAASHRPVQIEVRQAAFQRAWKAKLKQIEVECVLSDSLDSIEQLMNCLPSLNPTRWRRTDPTELLSLPLERKDVWQADIRPMPAWVAGEGQPYRPWVAMVISRTDDLVLSHRSTADRPPADWLWKAVLAAIRRPAMGDPHRPGMIEVGSVAQREALAPHLEQLDIRCVALQELDHLDAAIDDLANILRPRTGHLRCWTLPAWNWPELAASTLPRPISTGGSLGSTCPAIRSSKLPATSSRAAPGMPS